MTDLVVNDTGYTERQYTVTSVAIVNYIFDFEILLDTDLAVYLTPVGDEPDYATQQLTLNTDYSVTGADVTGGGYITILTDSITLAIGDIITIARNVAYDRLTDFSVGGSFKALTINDQLDRLVMQIQQVYNLIKNRGLTYDPTEELTSGNTNLPKLAALQFWKANSLGALVAATLEENPDWSTLRTELASATQAAPGAALIGFYDSVSLGQTTVDAYLKALVLGGEFKTGMMIFTFAATADPGWILYYAPTSTIGDAASGATARANDDCEALFKMLWNNTSDTYCPVIGGRGASAADDWAADKQITLPNVDNRALAVNGSGGSTVNKGLASYGGQENVSLEADHNGPHYHIDIPNITGGDAEGASGSGRHTASATNASSSWEGKGTAHLNVQPTLYLNIMIKL